MQIWLSQAVRPKVEEIPNIGSSFYALPHDNQRARDSEHSQKAKQNTEAAA